VTAAHAATAARLLALAAIGRARTSSKVTARALHAMRHVKENK